MSVFTRPGNRASSGGVDVGLRVDDKDLASILDELAHMPSEMKEAEYQAVKKTTKTGKTRVSRKFRDEMGPGVLNKKLVDARLRLRFPSKANPVGIISISNRGYPLHKYRGRPTTPPRQAGIAASRRNARQTARWTIHKKQGETTGRNHFVQRDKRGQVHIMARTPGGRGGRQATAPDDYRIKYGPGLVSIAHEFMFEDAIVIDLTDVLEKNLLSQVDRFLNRKKNG